MIHRQSLVVDTMTRFVQDTEERAGEMVLVVTGGNTGIPRPEAGAEGVYGLIQAAGIVVETDRLGGLDTKLLL